jgi:periplasmic protein TonB
MKPSFLSGLCAAFLLATPCVTIAADGAEAVPVVESIPVDYPVRALREGRQGAVTILLTVGADGRPKSCAIASSSGHVDLDRAACQSALRLTGFPPVADGSDRRFMRKAEFRIVQ